MRERDDLTIGEVARWSGVSKGTVSRQARCGQLPFRHTPGGHRRFNESEVMSWAEDVLGYSLDPLPR